MSPLKLPHKRVYKLNEICMLTGVKKRHVEEWGGLI